MSKMKKVYKQVDSLYLNGVITNCAVDNEVNIEIGIREIEERKTLGGTMLVMKNDGFPLVRGIAMRLGLVDDSIKWARIQLVISDTPVDPEKVSDEDIMTFEGKLRAGYERYHFGNMITGCDKTVGSECHIGDVDLIKLFNENKNKFIHMEVRFYKIVKIGLEEDDLKEMLKTQPEKIFNIENNLGLNREYITGPYKTWED